MNGGKDGAARLYRRAALVSALVSTSETIAEVIAERGNPLANMAERPMSDEAVAALSGLAVAFFLCRDHPELGRTLASALPPLPALADGLAETTARILRELGK